MLRIPGQMRVSATATGPAGFPAVSVVVTRPESTPEGVAVLNAEHLRWLGVQERFRDLVYRRRLPYEVARRAEFAATVMGIAAMNLRMNIPTILVAQAYDGRVLGVNIYALAGFKRAYLQYQAIDPVHVPDAPATPDQPALRGIGSALLAAFAQECLDGDVDEVQLHPLDENAYRFWRRRGFMVCGAGGLMCLRGRAAIEAFKAGCQTIGSGADDAWLLCSPRTPSTVRPMGIGAR